MAADDLTRPLGTKPTTPPRRPLPLKSLAGAVIGALLLVAGLWVLMVDDPHGGQPVAVVPIDPTPVGSVAETPAPQPAAPAGGQTVAAQQPISPHEIVIRDAGSGAAINLFTEPVSGLLERSAYGLIPKIGPSGIRPLEAYARPVDSGSDPAGARIAVVVTGLGLEVDATAVAMTDLPGEISLAFAADGDDLDRWVAQARTAGHEVLLQVPLEPINAVRPQVLRLEADAAENIDTLHQLMSRMTTYAGVIAEMGPRFATSDAALVPVLDEIGGRGLMFLDGGWSQASRASELAEGRVPAARADLAVDGTAGPAAIEEQLAELEAIASQRGYAIGSVEGNGLTVELLRDWAGRLQARGIKLVPVTALARG